MDKKSFIKKAGYGAIGLAGLLNVACNKDVDSHDIPKQSDTLEVATMTINDTTYSIATDKKNGSVTYFEKTPDGYSTKVVDSDGNNKIDMKDNDKITFQKDEKNIGKYGVYGVVDDKGNAHTLNTKGTAPLFELRTEIFKIYDSLKSEWRNKVYAQIENNMRTAALNIPNDKKNYKK